MKKNVKNTVIATSILLALAGSFMGCQQTVAPTPVDTTKTNKDVFEQQLGNSVMKAESLFGGNIVYFSDVNYANSYVLYRFGPMDDPLKGKNITIADSKNNSGFDGFVVYDIVSPDNYMVPGNYTYKLVAKSDVNSARAALPDLNKGTQNPANQDYWANPKVDIVYLPSLAEVSVNVPKENMPTYKTQLSLKKEEVKYVKYTDAEKNVHWKLVPSANKNGVTIFAQFEDDINKLVIESKKENSSADKGYVNDKKDSDDDITIPESSALKGKWNVYAQWTCPSYLKKTDGTPNQNYEYYIASEKVLLDTIEVDAPYPTANFLVTPAARVASEGKNKAKYGLTWNVKTEVADMYTFSAKRAVIETRKSPDVSDNTSAAKPIVTPDSKLIKVYKDLTNVTFTAPVKTVNSDTTTFTVYDESVEQGKKYIYFWTFTPNNAKYNKVTGATELSENIKLADDFDKLVPTTVTGETYKCTVDKTSDKEFKTATFRFTSKIQSVTNEATPVDIDYNRFSVDSVKRIAYDENDKNIGEGSVTYDYFYDYSSNKGAVISVTDVVPFKEINPLVKEYGYSAVLTDKLTGKKYEIENLLTTQDTTSKTNKVKPISKLRYDVKTPNLKSATALSDSSVKVVLNVSVEPKSEQYGTETTGMTFDNGTVSCKLSKAKYTIRDATNNKFVADGRIASDVELKNGIDKEVTITLRNIKLVSGEDYKLFIEGTDKAADGYQFNYTKK